MKLRTILNEIVSDSKYIGTILLLKNTDKAPNRGSRFGQDVEPIYIVGTIINVDIGK